MSVSKEFYGVPCFRIPVSGTRGKCVRMSLQVAEQRPSVTIQQLIDREYVELNPEFLREKVKGVRRRHHCNPMKASLMEELHVPDWSGVFADPELPLAVDIGSGQGRFAMLMAKRNAGVMNFLGLDVRKMLVDKCNVWAEELNLANMRFMTANATVSFRSLISTYPGKLMLASILCPDPHFKKRHRKRRIVQPGLVEFIVEQLASGGKIFLQSDVEEVAADMRSQFEERIRNDTGVFERFERNDGWLSDNPLGVKTEREIAVIAQGGNMYRIMYERR